MKRKLSVCLFAVLLIGLALPSQTVIPVKNASCHDWNPKTFWFEPWGSSGVHKGIDVFAAENTPAIAAASGFVLFKGELAKGGKVVLMLGPKWRLHYYAHLSDIESKLSFWVDKGQQIGGVGTTGNAVGKPAHLHYSVVTLLPYPWLITSETQGWKKMFYLDPALGFESCQS